MAVQTGDNATMEFTHFVSIDFGTSGCGIAMATKEKKSDIKLFTAWEGLNTDAKCPTVLLLDPDENFERFGVNAIVSYETTKWLFLRARNLSFVFYFTASLNAHVQASRDSVRVH